MTTRVEAVYEKGLLKLRRPLELIEGSVVDVIVTSREPLSGSTKPAELLAEIAALPVQESDQDFTAREHDRILYGSEPGR